MNVEIEHKYTVVDASYRQMSSRSIHTSQGYLSRCPDTTIRIRIADNVGMITIKTRNQGDSRREYEYPIPVDDARQLLAMCPPPIIDKVRDIVEFHGHCWEVDEFSSPRQGLVVADIELPDSQTPSDLPPFVGENVTGNPDYYNSNLR